MWKRIKSEVTHLKWNVYLEGCPFFEMNHLKLRSKDVKQKRIFLHIQHLFSRVETKNWGRKYANIPAKFNSNYCTFKMHKKPPVAVNICVQFSLHIINLQCEWVGGIVHIRDMYRRRDSYNRQASKAVERKIAIKYSPLFMNCTLQSSNYFYFFAFSLLLSETCLMTIKKA